MAHEEIERQFAAAGCAGALHTMRLRDGAEVGVRADEPQVAASVIKVPIGLELCAQFAAGRLDPARPIVLQPAGRTWGPVGISQATDPVTMSLRDLGYLMLAVSDNAATDAVLAAVGVEALNARLAELGCTGTCLVGDVRTMLDGFAEDLGFRSFAEAQAADRGELGDAARVAAGDPARIQASRALDPARATRTTARDMTRLLAAVWRDQAAPAEACAALRETLGKQLTRRLAPAVPAGGQLAAKSGGLFGRVRNEVAVITDGGGMSYAVAVFTRAERPHAGEVAIDAAMAEAVRLAIGALSPSQRPAAARPAC